MVVAAAAAAAAAAVVVMATARNGLVIVMADLGLSGNDKKIISAVNLGDMNGLRRQQPLGVACKFTRGYLCAHRDLAVGRFERIARPTRAYINLSYLTAYSGLLSTWQRDVALCGPTEHRACRA